MYICCCCSLSLSPAILTDFLIIKAALEYAKMNFEEGKQMFAPIVPVGIVYPDKSKYRSVVIVK